jgi:uncharacterized NAD(P)/FAD-binding protein YdhS
MNPPQPSPGRTVAVVGGGFSGTLFALKLSAARPDWRVLLIEPSRPARGLAYGAAAPQHLLNVPVTRMEVGLKPAFATWLEQRRELLADALAEADGRLADAFVPRRLFGDYLAERLEEGLHRPNLALIEGEVVSLADKPRAVVLADGRTLAADQVVLALGNLPGASPFRPSPRLVADPWAAGALDSIAPGASLLLIGTGLTMVDVIMSLRARGHRGALHAVSRHGLLPRSHASGGNWRTDFSPGLSPVQTLRAIRREVTRAIALGTPWQRVFDAVRPMVAHVWSLWSPPQKKSFLRHLRSIWEVHRHRMAGRLDAAVRALLADGALTVTAARVLALDAGRDHVAAFIRPPGEKPRLIEADQAILCMGPLMDLRKSPLPLLRDLFARGLVREDALHLGLENRDCALLDTQGVESDWLFALGPSTRPALWEIVAVPEINAQIDQLVGRIASDATPRALHAVFVDIGAGI